VGVCVRSKRERERDSERNVKFRHGQFIACGGQVGLTVIPRHQARRRYNEGFLRRQSSKRGVTVFGIECKCGFFEISRKKKIWNSN